MRVRSVVVVLVCCDCHSLATTTTTPKAAAAAFSSNHNNSNLWRGGGGGEGDWLSAAKRKVRQYSTAGGLGGSGATTAWRAYELRKSELNLHPDDPLLQLETAEALLKWIRHTTNGNFPKAASGEVCEGDSPSSRKVWRKYAPEALRLLKGGAAHALEGEAYDVAKVKRNQDALKISHMFLGPPVYDEETYRIKVSFLSNGTVAPGVQGGGGGWHRPVCYYCCNLPSCFLLSLLSVPFLRCRFCFNGIEGSPQFLFFGS